MYVITCSANGHQYVGSSSAIAGRWAVHVSHLELKRHHNARLQRDWDRYGAKKFNFAIIDVTPHGKSLLEREQYHIDRLKPWYNQVAAATPRPSAGKTVTNCQKKNGTGTSSQKDNASTGRGRTGTPRPGPKIQS